MRHCEECQYLSSTGGEYPELYCILVGEDDPKVDEDEKGLGCHYNLRTLKKLARERDEAEYREYLGYDDFFYADGIDMTVWYSSGDTAAKTPFDCMHKLENGYVIGETNLGGSMT